MTTRAHHPAGPTGQPYVLLSLAIGLVAFAGSAQAAGEHNGPFHAWFERQITPDGTGRSCCVEADGHILADEDWRISDGDYQVRIGDAWITFENKGQGNPGNKILGQTNNPTGSAVAWWVESAGKVYPLCFAPGTVS